MHEEQEQQNTILRKNKQKGHSTGIWDIRDLARKGQGRTREGEEEGGL
jgi:hypothetical protein